MVTWTRDDIRSYEARNQPKGEAIVDQSIANEAVKSESDLHDRIMQECRRRQWIALHGRMDYATGRTKGEPDFIIIADGAVYFIECKTKTGKLSPDQQAIAHQASRLGHTIHLVRSFQQFLDLVNR